MSLFKLSLFKAFGKWMWDARVYVLGLIAVIAWICLYPVYAPKLVTVAPPPARAEQVEALTEESLSEIQQNAFEQTASWVWAFAGGVFLVIFAVAAATFINVRSRIPYHYQPTPVSPVKKIGGSADNVEDAAPKRDEPEPLRPARRERSEFRRARPPAAVVQDDGGEEDDPESFAARLQRRRETRT